MKKIIFLPVFLFLFTCHSAPDQSTEEPPAADSNFLFRNVTQSHLPFADLEGLSMDARAADIDTDGDLDIVIANEFRPNILLLNDGEGRFSNAGERLPRAGRDSEDVGIADFDEDKDLDIVIVSEDDEVNELYLNRGDGSFEAAGDRLPVTGVSNAVVVADINIDGHPDILIGNNGQNRILINDGNANFSDETGDRLPAIEDITQDIELGDVDGDGDPDLLVGNEDRNRLLLNDGSGVFTDDSEARIPLREAPEETREADFGDIDGDGDLDILFANTEAFVEGALRQNRLLINDGKGFFTDETAQRLPEDQDRSFEGDFLDIDGDGDLDIMTGNSNAPNFRGETPFRVLLNDGDGVFRDATGEVLPPGTEGSGFDVEFADFNGDGKPDLYLASRGTVDLLLFAE